MFSIFIYFIQWTLYIWNAIYCKISSLYVSVIQVVGTTFPKETSTSRVWSISPIDSEIGFDGAAIVRQKRLQYIPRTLRRLWSNKQIKQLYIISFLYFN